MSQPITAIKSTKALPCLPAARTLPTVITTYKTLHLNNSRLEHKDEDESDATFFANVNCDAISNPKNTYAMESAKRFGITLKPTPKIRKTVTFTVLKDWKAEDRQGFRSKKQGELKNVDLTSAIARSSPWHAELKPVVKPASHNGPETALQMCKSSVNKII